MKLCFAHRRNARQRTRRKKASGLLCVDGTLYLWTRNATNSQLAWSGDLARRGRGPTGASLQFRLPDVPELRRNYASARTTSLTFIR
jgi:hypothetical protein